MSTGGSSSPNSQTVYQSSLPEYVKSDFQDLLARGTDVSEEPYQPYSGDRLAGKSATTQAGMDKMSDWAGSSSTYGDSMNRTQGYGDQMGDVVGQYDPNAYQPHQYQNAISDWGGLQMNGQNYGGGINQLYGGEFGQAQADQYMSPYINNVINATKGGMLRDYQEQQAMNNANAASSGAFGGSRAALMDAAAQRAFMNRSSEMEASMLQGAFENAQGMFGQDRNARLQAEQANQGVAADMMNRNQNMLLETQQLQDEADRYGAEYGDSVLGQILTGLETQGGMEDRLSSLQQLFDQSETARANAMLGLGQTEESYDQEQLDLAYRDFLNQRDYERGQVAWMASLLKGVPVNNNQEVSQYEKSNPLLGGLGTLVGMQGLNGVG